MKVQSIPTEVEETVDVVAEPVVEEQKVVSDTGKTTYTNDQKHKEEVPAFLRRQAN